jgi:hypothetical protein
MCAGACQTSPRGTVETRACCGTGACRRLAAVMEAKRREAVELVTGKCLSELPARGPVVALPNLVSN